MKEKCLDDFEKAARGRPREFDRDQALHKALELFWEQGYMQTSMSQLCMAMGIKSPSLYCAFGCKADLFLEAVTYYRQTYWSGAFQDFLDTAKLMEGWQNLLDETARILLMPKAPCGCLTVVSALSLPQSEKKVGKTIQAMREETRNIFFKRLARAKDEGELEQTVDLEILAGAMVNFFEGLTLQARDKNISLENLRKIARQGIKLLE